MFETRKQGAVDVISGGFPINEDYAQHLNELFDHCLSHGQPRVVFDLGRVPLIDSAGLELLLNAAEACAQRGGSMKLCRPNPLVNEILAATGVGRQFEIFSDTSTAVGSFVQ